jgi:hypothetical protein
VNTKPASSAKAEAASPPCPPAGGLVGGGRRQGPAVLVALAWRVHPLLKRLRLPALVADLQAPQGPAALVVVARRAHPLPGPLLLQAFGAGSVAALSGSNSV